MTVFFLKTRLSPGGVYKSRRIYEPAADESTAGGDIEARAG